MKRAAPLRPLSVPAQPWQDVLVDLMGPFPESQGFDMIMVVVDRFSKKAFFLPTNLTITSLGVAQLFQDNVFREHGLPNRVISD